MYVKVNLLESWAKGDHIPLVVFQGAVLEQSCLPRSQGCCYPAKGHIFVSLGTQYTAISILKTKHVVSLMS